MLNSFEKTNTSFMPVFYGGKAAVESVPSKSTFEDDCKANPRRLQYNWIIISPLRIKNTWT